MSEFLIKDDTELMEGITRRKEERRARRLPDRDEGLSDPATLKAEWERIQQARTSPGTYYIVIEYRDCTYHAQALSFPEVSAQGETVDAVKEKVAEALRAHFAGLRARGEAVPIREQKRVETVEVSLEDVQQIQPAEMTEEGAPTSY